MSERVEDVLAEVAARHVSYTARILDARLDVREVAYCTKCGLGWPCDAARLVQLLTKMIAPAQETH